MSYPQDRNIHRPSHIYLDSQTYFVTARTLDGVKYFHSTLKDLILESLQLAQEKYKFKLFAWVILDNHYHCLLEVNQGMDLGKIIRFINGRSARLLKKSKLCDAPSRCVMSDTLVTKPEPSSGKNYHLPILKPARPASLGEAHSPITKPEASSCRPIWYQYREKIVDTEKTFYTYFNYIHFNPIKHSLVSNKQALTRYRYCSYRSWLDKMGVEWVDDVSVSYPVESLEILES
ncbi:transposase [Candidatus Falkowbacteria bacterium]|nr:transposase [Candidatus Falkowbacteria bacterium]